VKIRIVCIGNEILSGETLNTNLAFSGRKLVENGLRVEREICVPDNGDAIRAAVDQALEPPACVITIGGLGPTGDDITRQTVAALLGRPLSLNEEVAAGIRRFLRQRGVSIPAEAIRAQALVGFRLLELDKGVRVDFVPALPRLAERAHARGLPYCFPQAALQLPGQGPLSNVEPHLHITPKYPI